LVERTEQRVGSDGNLSADEFVAQKNDLKKEGQTNVQKKIWISADSGFWENNVIVSVG
jgi:hypothetical protein